MNKGGRTEQMEAMGAVPTLFAVVHKLSTATAGNEWGLYKEPVSGKEEDKTVVTSHAALDLLKKPNPWMPWTEFVEVTQQHIDLTGEGWWVLVKSARVPMAGPLEIWPIRPDRMEPNPDPKDFLVGYVYTAPDGQKIGLGVDEVIQIRMPNPLDVYRGLGPVQALLVDLDSARYTAEWNRNFFKNSAEPGGIIQVDGRLDDNEFDELQLRWAEQHKGVANAHRVAILERAQWVDRKFTMRDMQFTELKRMTRDQILEGFGFPKVMLGATDGVNLANALAGEYMFSKWLVKTRLDRLKGAIDNELLPMFGPTAKGIVWDYESPVPEDEAAENAELTAKVNAFVALVNAGVDADSACEVVDLPKMVMRKSTQPNQATGALPNPDAAALVPERVASQNSNGRREMAMT
jgi:HK97 family phage portal protein